MVPTGLDPDTLRTTMEEAARRFVRTREASDDQEDTLQAIVSGVMVAVAEVSAASVSLVQPDGVVVTRAPSSELVAEIDRLQTQLHEGPCIDALDEQRPDVTHAPDLGQSSPWPRFATEAMRSGMASVLSFQLITQQGGGALNLYGETAHCFDTTAQMLGALFADQAAVALAGARRSSDLNRALATRDVIGQAKGILMERFSVDDQRAFRMLVESSQQTNVKLRDVAAWVVQDAGGKRA